MLSLKDHSLCQWNSEFLWDDIVTESGEQRQSPKDWKWRNSPRKNVSANYQVPNTHTDRHTQPIHSFMTEIFFHLSHLDHIALLHSFLSDNNSEMFTRVLKGLIAVAHHVLAFFLPQVVAREALGESKEQHFSASTGGQIYVQKVCLNQASFNLCNVFEEGKPTRGCFNRARTTLY